MHLYAWSTACFYIMNLCFQSSKNSNFTFLLDENTDVYEEEENLIHSRYAYKFSWRRCEFKTFILWYVLPRCINHAAFNCIMLSEIESLYPYIFTSWTLLKEVCVIKYKYQKTTRFTKQNRRIELHSLNQLNPRVSSHSGNFFGTEN